MIVRAAIKHFTTPLAILSQGAVLRSQTGQPQATARSVTLPNNDAAAFHLRVSHTSVRGANPLTAAAHADQKTAGGVRNSPYRPWITTPRG